MTIVGFDHHTVVTQGADQAQAVLAVYWNSGPAGGIVQGHIRAAVFTAPALTLVNEPHVFNQGFCFGYPAVSSNILGDIGVTLAFGGQAGGAVQGAVGIDDPFTPGVGFFQTLFPTAAGVDNRPDGRFGDYFTIHRHLGCTKWFAATNYAWNSSPADSASDVNSRYVEFGRQKYLTCYRRGGGQ
jgi:hypothetical protein